MPMMPPPPPSHPRPRPFPYRPQYVIVRPVACRAVYNNSNVINALNGLLANCDTLKVQGVNTCSTSFKDAVQKELSNQISKSVYIGQDCGSTNVYPTYNRIY